MVFVDFEVAGQGEGLKTAGFGWEGGNVEVCERDLGALSGGGINGLLLLLSGRGLRIREGLRLLLDFGSHGENCALEVYE